MHKIILILLALGSFYPLAVLGTVQLQPIGTGTEDEILNSQKRVFQSLVNCVKVMDTAGGKKSSVYKCADRFLDPQLPTDRKQQITKLFFSDFSMSYPSVCSEEQLSKQNLIKLNSTQVLCFTLFDGGKSHPGYVFYKKGESGFVISEIKSF